MQVPGTKGSEAQNIPLLTSIPTWKSGLIEYMRETMMKNQRTTLKTRIPTNGLVQFVSMAILKLTVSMRQPLIMVPIKNRSSLKPRLEIIPPNTLTPQKIMSECTKARKHHFTITHKLN
eukprot:32162_2